MSILARRVQPFPAAMSLRNQASELACQSRRGEQQPSLNFEVSETKPLSWHVNLRSPSASLRQQARLRNQASELACQWRGCGCA